jgi:hypothetical protein
MTHRKERASARATSPEEFPHRGGTDAPRPLGAEAIVDDAERQRASVIAVAIGARSSLYRLVFGSTAMASAHATRNVT